MTYDPFARGIYPVGVRTLEATDSARSNRALPIEVWYPATDAHAGQDLADATRDHYDVMPGFLPVWQAAVRDAAARDARWPLVAFSHGFGGHRRQSTFLCTHLASHGYVVAAVDHTGNTVLDILQLMLSLQAGGAMPHTRTMLEEFIGLRPADIAFMIDRVATEMAGSVDLSRIGMTGHSFGGWTTLTYTARDPRICAALPLAPAGGATPLPGDALRDSVDLRWGRPVPTLYLVADRDTLLPLDGMRGLYARTAAPKRMVVLRNADHMHFCDRVEEVHELFRSMPPPGEFAQLAQLVPPIGELCSGEDAYLYVRGLGLAHMDAHLKGNEQAAALVAGDVTATLAARGVAVSVE